VYLSIYPSVKLSICRQYTSFVSTVSINLQQKSNRPFGQSTVYFYLQYSYILVIHLRAVNMLKSVFIYTIPLSTVSIYRHIPSSTVSSYLRILILYLLYHSAYSIGQYKISICSRHLSVCYAYLFSESVFPLSVSLKCLYSYRIHLC
jgi:hypothetical protein